MHRKKGIDANIDMIVDRKIGIAKKAWLKRVIGNQRYRLYRIDAQSRKLHKMSRICTFMVELDYISALILLSIYYLSISLFFLYLLILTLIYVAVDVHGQLRILLMNILVIYVKENECLL